jgi:PAS domain-containing protein
VHVHNLGKPLFNANREFQGYRCCGTDITRQRQAENAALQSEQRFRDFAETAADWFWEQDADLKFIYISSNFPGIAGLPINQILGKTREQLFNDQNYSASHWLIIPLSKFLPFASSKGMMYLSLITFIIVPD